MVEHERADFVPEHPGLLSIDHQSRTIFPQFYRYWKSLTLDVLLSPFKDHISCPVCRNLHLFGLK